MLTYLRQLQNERDTLTQSATAITEQAAREERDVTDTERSTLATMAERCATIDGQLETFGQQLEAQRRYAQLRTDLDGADDTPPRHAEVVPRRPAQLQTRDARAWGDLFVESAEFRGYDGHGSTAPVRVPGIFTRDPINLDGIGGLPVQPYTYTIQQPAITTPLLDAVGHVTTNSNVVQWLADPGAYPQAAVVAEGATKPEANFQLQTASGELQTYAHYKGITRQALANIPMIQSIVEQFLRGGIYSKLEVDVAAAIAAATLQQVPVTAGAELAAIREAVGMVQAAGFPNANTVLLNPADWAGLDVAVMQGTNGPPVGTSAFWGLRPVSSAAVPKGTMYVGDLKSAVTLFDEGQASVFMTDSHADYFVRNILVILAEIMALALVTQGAALVKVGGTSTLSADSGDTVSTAK